MVGKDQVAQRAESPLEHARIRGKVYSRVYITDAVTAQSLIAPGGELSPGSPMPESWYGGGVPLTAQGAAGARLQSVSIRPSPRDVGGVLMQCSFIEFIPAGSFVDGYAPLSDYDILSEDDTSQIYDGWGIAELEGASLPQIGSVVVSDAGVSGAVIFQQQIIRSYHGRLIVQNLARALKRGATCNGYGPMPIRSS